MATLIPTEARFLELWIFRSIAQFVQPLRDHGVLSIMLLLQLWCGLRYGIGRCRIRVYQIFEVQICW